MVLKRQVTVRFLGFLERLAGRREASVEIEDGTTVQDLLSLLGEAYGAEFRAAVFRAPDQVQVQTHLRVFLNDGEACMTDDVTGPDAPAKVNLMVLPAFEGGG